MVEERKIIFFLFAIPALSRKSSCCPFAPPLTRQPVRRLPRFRLLHKSKYIISIFLVMLYLMQTVSYADARSAFSASMHLNVRLSTEDFRLNLHSDDGMWNSR